ncbi:glycosyltransferase family 4 protein [Clostridium paraputrificum]|uniref:glycosyltransferase family 4 protein n=1 Tax=Clostridium paraputrificum TaxID=29363 RepID=UPI0003FAC56B|nr:glycosyltransferase family 4 protein [Clostridium paraputrificum]
MAKRIMIIDHFSQTPEEPGNNRFIYLATILSREGFDVEVVTTDFSHKNKKTRIRNKKSLLEVPYKFQMLQEPGYYKNVSLRRFYSHYIFGKNLKKYLKTVKKPDLIYIAVPSLNVGSVCVKYCKKNKIPLITDIQDLWPEAFKLVFNIPVLSYIIFAPMMHIENNIYKESKRIVAVSETYKLRGLKNCINDSNGMCVYLGTDLEEFDKNVNNIIVKKNEDECWITYVGTLGISYNIKIIIDALDALSDRLPQNVIFKVFGDGPQMEQFEKYAIKKGVRAEFKGRIDYPHMVAYLSKSDIAVNPIAKGAAQSIINKHADYAAAGLPVVNTQECEEYRSLINKYKCGINCGVDSISDVADAIEKLINDKELRKKMGWNSRRMAEERFNRSYTYMKIVDEIERVCRR